MAFADPQSINSATLPRTSSGTSEGQFTSNDQLNKLIVRHTSGNKRVRHYLRLDNAKIAADPLLAGVNVRASMSAQLIVDVPETGYTVAEAKVIVDAFTAYLTASTGAKVTQLLGGEN